MKAADAGMAWMGCRGGLGGMCSRIGSGGMWSGIGVGEGAASGAGAGSPSGRTSLPERDGCGQASCVRRGQRSCVMQGRGSCVRTDAMCGHPGASVAEKLNRGSLTWAHHAVFETDPRPSSTSGLCLLTSFSSSLSPPHRTHLDISRRRDSSLGAPSGSRICVSVSTADEQGAWTVQKTVTCSAG